MKLITTAISYPNGAPHIGHAYEAIVTDALARFARLAGNEVRFLTGTDEHGLKMEQTARDLGVTTQALADKNSKNFNNMCEVFNIKYDRFIRTTDADHKLICQELWRRMAANGDIYQGRYEGWYSVRDEAYYESSELVTTEDGRKVSPQGTAVEWTVEESYFFRLSHYTDKLLAYYENHRDFILPESRRNEIMAFVKGGLRDLSISRSSFAWGVPVPGDERHIMYVWVDALTNYLTGVGDKDAQLSFDTLQALWEKADITHIIGKDIVRFHTVYWPAFLLSAGLKLPERVFGHGFLLNRGEKMSKSTGNVVDPIELAQRLGAEAVRWYMLRKVSFGEDGVYSPEAIVETYNADLANSFGNLVQRVLSFIAKNLEGRTPMAASMPMPADTLLREEVAAVVVDYQRRFSDLHPAGALEAWMRGVFACNQYVDAQAPWTLRKTDPARMEAVLHELLVAIYQLALTVQPAIPDASARVLDQLGIALDARQFRHLALPPHFALKPPSPTFPRMEMVVDNA